VEWALALVMRLESIWPCTIPFLLGLSLATVQRWFMHRATMKIRQEIIAEQQMLYDNALKQFELEVKRKHVNGSNGTGSNGAWR